MYILSVIPIKRRIPGGELTYISKERVSVGTILNVPLKKSKEMVIVVKQNEVSKEKEFIKSINFKIITLNELEILAILQVKVLHAISDFCKYSVCEMDVVVRALFSKISVNNSNTKINKYKQVTITTKQNKLNPSSISFHKCMEIFTGKNTFYEIIIDNPKSLTLYGQNYLGFDPVPFFIILAKKINKPISFNSSIFVLSYEEWHLNKKNIDLSKLGDLQITMRNIENKNDLNNPLSEYFFDLMRTNILENKKVLIITNSKNYALKTVCHDCSKLHECVNCGKALVLVTNNRNYAKKYGVAGNYIYICTHCSIAENSIAKCRNCDSWNLVPLGYGTQRLMEQIKDNLDKAIFKKVYDMTDRISLNNLKSWNESGGVLVVRPNQIYETGFADVSLVPSVSPVLYDKSFSSLENTINLLQELQTISTQVYLNVMNEQERDVLLQDRNKWLQNEILDRKTFNYPPYGRLLKLELDAYASKSSTIINAILGELNKIAIPNTVSKDKNPNGNILINASFDNNNWSIEHSDYETAQKIKIILLPFLKHLKIAIC